MRMWHHVLSRQTDPFLDPDVFSRIREVALSATAVHCCELRSQGGTRVSRGTVDCLVSFRPGGPVSFGVFSFLPSASDSFTQLCPLLASLGGDIPKVVSAWPL